MYELVFKYYRIYIPKLVREKWVQGWGIKNFDLIHIDNEQSVWMRVGFELM